LNRPRLASCIMASSQDGSAQGRVERTRHGGHCRARSRPTLGLQDGSPHMVGGLDPLRLLKRIEPKRRGRDAKRHDPSSTKAVSSTVPNGHAHIGHSEFERWGIRFRGHGYRAVSTQRELDGPSSAVPQRAEDEPLLNVSAEPHGLDTGAPMAVSKWKARRVISSSGSRPEARPDHLDNSPRRASTNCPTDKP
jgi:hypothetical protein